MPRAKPIGFLRDLETLIESLIVSIQESIATDSYGEVRQLAELVSSVQEVSTKMLNLKKSLRDQISLDWSERTARKTIANHLPRHKNKCGFKTCNYRQLGLGYCQGHLEQLKLGNNLTPLVNYRRVKKGCNFEGCHKPHSSKGLCDGHRKQEKQGKVLTPLKSRTSKGRTCDQEECYDEHVARGKCKRHYEEFFVRGRRQRDQFSKAL